MFTVSGRVINELAELTCAINFSLLFRFEAQAQKAKQPSLHGGWREGKGKQGREGKKEGTLKQQHCLQFVSK